MDMWYEEILFFTYYKNSPGTQRNLKDGFMCPRKMCKTNFSPALFSELSSLVWDFLCLNQSSHLVSAATNISCIFRDLLKQATQHWPGCLWAKQQKSLCPRTTFYWNHPPSPCSKSYFSTSPSSFYIWPIYLPSYVPNFLPKEEHTLDRHCAVRANTQQNPIFVCSVVLHNCHAQSRHR